MGDNPRIAIIGPGKVGTALGVLARRAGWGVAAVGGRDAERADEAARRIGGGAQALSPAAAARQGMLVLLTVSDDAIAGVCAQLAREQSFQQGAVVAHCSGALPGEALSPARALCGCHVGSLHPLQTFPDADAAVRVLPEAHFFCEGDTPAVSALSRLGGAIGQAVVNIPPAGKGLYHAGAVMACNALVALYDAAIGLFAAGGIDRRTAQAALKPIMRATLENVAALGPENALTGPIVRGNIRTVDLHLQAMAQAGIPDAFYRAASLEILAVALRRNALDEETCRKLRNLLGDRGGGSP